MQLYRSNAFHGAQGDIAQKSFLFGVDNSPPYQDEDCEEGRNDFMPSVAARGEVAEAEIPATGEGGEDALHHLTERDDPSHHHQFRLGW